MNNPLIIPILGYLRAQHSSCSLIDLVNLCQQDLLSLIGSDVDPQIVIFQKNFFVMNALYQIQRDVQSDGFLLNVFPLEICLVANTTYSENQLTTRDMDLAKYYLDWSNLSNVTVEDVDALFSSFWQKYIAVDKVESALTTLGLALDIPLKEPLDIKPPSAIGWPEIRQAYLKNIAINHPDKGGNTEDFIAIREAYEILRLSYQKT